MIKLIVPCEEYLSSYMDAYDEYAHNHVSTYSFTDASSCDIFAKFDDYRNERNLKPGRVGADYYWLVDDEKEHFIGEVTIRHALNDALMQSGGHIGYGIRYSEWNHGYGTVMLALALKKAEELGIPTVQITCNDDNLASARVMEKNGFVLIDKVFVSEDGEAVLRRRYQKQLDIQPQ
ncbi:MAG: GNAT family N-acetyltransferase [Clostridia bacterium]|nr:GNAT family N-acetyltransferase [Clostridia bacterium]